MPWPVNVDATWLDGGASLDGGELRRADAAILAGGNTGFGIRGGIVRHEDSSLLVSVDASDNVTIQPGSVAVPGNFTAGSGGYRFGLGTAATNALTARNASLGRVDRVVARALDTSVRATHAAYTGRFDVLAGTPNATPLSGIAALPEMAIELARINVPATGGGSATVDLSFRTFAAALGGILPVVSSARLPATALFGDRALALDTGVTYVWTGTSWVSEYPLFRGTIAAGAAVAATPTNIPWSTVTDTDAGNSAGTYTVKRAGQYRITVVLQNNGAVGAGQYMAILKNGVSVFNSPPNAALPGPGGFAVNYEAAFAAGDTISTRVLVGFTATSGGQETFISIEYIRP